MMDPVEARLTDFSVLLKSSSHPPLQMSDTYLCQLTDLTDTSDLTDMCLREPDLPRTRLCLCQELKVLPNMVSND